MPAAFQAAALIPFALATGLAVFALVDATAAALLHRRGFDRDRDA